MNRDICTIINIKETRILTGVNYLQVKDELDIDDLFEIFLTDVFLNNKYQFTIDSFRLLYKIINTIYRMHNVSDFLLDIGEGLDIEGSIMPNSTDIFLLRIVATGTIVHECQLPRSAIYIMLSLMLADLARSIYGAGVDVDQYIRKFPPNLVR